MNDDDLITLVRESFTGLHATTPVDQILRRGHAVRTRRRIPVLTGVLAVAAGAVLAVTTLLPGGHQPSPRPSPLPAAQLAAWTVTRQADGTIRVTIRELQDPAGLQSRLRADGVPASVTLTGQENPACRPYPASATLAGTPSAAEPGPGVPHQPFGAARRHRPAARHQLHPGQARPRD